MTRQEQAERAAIAAANLYRVMPPVASPEEAPSWRCAHVRSHGVCNSFNGAESDSCGACGEDRPAPEEARPTTEGGIQEARRIITNSVGYYFGGELTPFDPAFKNLALKAIASLESRLAESQQREAALLRQLLALDPESDIANGGTP